MAYRVEEYVGRKVIDEPEFLKDSPISGTYRIELSDEEIIRCRDCKHSKLTFLRCKKSFTPIFAKDGEQIGFEESRIDPDGFCVWAERDA